MSSRLMSEYDQELLERRRVVLVKKIDLQAGPLLDELRALGALTPENVQFIRTKGANFEQVGALLDTLRRGDQYAMEKFLTALQNNGHGALSEELASLRHPADTTVTLAQAAEMNAAVSYEGDTVDMR